MQITAVPIKKTKILATAYKKVRLLENKYLEYAVMFKALSDPNRLVIVDYLLDGEVCACKILDQLKITQSTLSYHMKMLCESNLVSARKEGKWMHYSLNKEKMDELQALLYQFSDRSEDIQCSTCK